MEKIKTLYAAPPKFLNNIHISSTNIPPQRAMSLS
jgi:hypothetical protein